MKYILLVLVVTLASCGNTYYIVRHAEKAPQQQGGSSDVELSAAGKERAKALKDELADKRISTIYSTNTIRTKTTAQPLADYLNVTVQTYGPRPDTAFIQSLKMLKSNTLIVGHSNTIDDVVNMLCGEVKVPGDLPETAFDNLYVVKRKGKKFTFTNKKYGVTTN